MSALDVAYGGLAVSQLAAQPELAPPTAADVWAVPRLRVYERLILLYFAHAQDHGGEVKTTPRKVAELLACDARTAGNAIADMAALGLIEIVDNRGGRGRDNTYRLSL